MRLRTDLAVEAREIAGENIGGVDFDTYSENGMEISRLTVRTERARLALGKEEGTYVTIELESLTDRFSDTDGRLRTIGAEIRRSSRDSATRRLRPILSARKPPRRCSQRATSRESSRARRDLTGCGLSR